jgi:putative thioredoxin
MNHPTQTLDFERDVIEQSRRVPVLVDFWAPWCGPCRTLGPVLEKLAFEAGGAWTLVKVDTDQHQDVAARFGIRGIPDVRLFHHGQAVAQFTGALPESHVRRWLAEHLPTPKRDAMARAREHLRAGRAGEASRLLEPLVAAEPGDAELLSLSARALVFVDPPGAVSRLERLPRSHPWEENAMIAREFARLFSGGSGDLPEGPARDAYREAADAIRGGRFEEGGRKLIDLLMEAPGFDDGHARAACLALFKHLGMRHPVAEKLSRAFSMAVNV